MTRPNISVYIERQVLVQTRLIRRLTPRERRRWDAVSAEVDAYASRGGGLSA